MRSYISYHEVECFICKKTFSKQFVGRKPQVELALNRNQYCDGCWEKQESKKLPIIQLSQITGFITIVIYNSFSIRGLLRSNGYKFTRDAKGNAYWKKVLEAASFEENLILTLTASKKRSWLKKLNNELKKLLIAEKDFIKTKLLNHWQLNDDSESKKLFDLDFD